MPVLAGSLLLLIAPLLAIPVSLWVADAIADTGGGAASTAVTPDVVSDAVAATAAEFRVDESGAATYSIPIYAVPGTAGVAPKLSLSYSSQGGYGPLGKGWSIGGLSSITRCRATREAGDFIGAATPDGDPRPINFTATDRYCLDGQRLLAVSDSPACPSVGGMTVQQLRTEIESFQRVCAYTSSNSPAFFTVERKDGSISWYGDRDNNSTANRPDGYVESNAPGQTAKALFWAQTRFQDSTGNYIDFTYLENPGTAAGGAEHLIQEVRYTGKTALAGQSAGASAPYAKIQFQYTSLPSAEWRLGYVSGGTRTQRWRLTGIVSCAAAGSVGSTCATASQARFYQPTYAAGVSGSGLAEMTGLKECRDNTQVVCAASTAFAWSQGKYEFATTEPATILPTSSSGFEGFKLADVDGDGRQDMVYFKDALDSNCGTEYMYVVYSSMADDLNSTSDFVQSSSAICTPNELMYPGWVSEGSWHLFDYNGDGRDDLFVRGAGSWVVYPSQGRSGNMNFVTGNNLIASLSPAIPVMDGTTSQPQLADLNGDGLTDVVYPSGGVMRARLMERQSGGFGWGAERTVAVDQASLGPEDPECSVASNYCTRSISSVPTPKTGFLQMADFNGDAASDLLINVTNTIHYDPILCDPYLAEGASMAGSFTEGVGLSEAGESEPIWTVLPYTEEPTPGDAAQMAPPDNCVRSASSTMIHAFSVQALTATTVGIGSYAPIVPSTVDQLRLIDANGDGLTEVAYHYPNSTHWYYEINTGTGMAGWTDLGDYYYWGQVQFADVNGDGRTDLLPLADVGGNRVYQARLAQPGGGFAAATAIPGGQAIYCGGSCNLNQFAPLFADLDGDGNLDFMSIFFDTNPKLYVHRASSRYAPRGVITQVTNGLGAQTNITYAPLTNKDVYRRDAGSRNGLNWGRGSPVMDLLAPSYAVARVSSSSPQADNPNAMATVHYRYAGARVQAGGRGFLGFETIDTVDPNQSGGYVVTTTNYAQNFPFVGMPVQTTKKAANGMAYFVPTCLNGSAITDACFSTPGTAHPDLGGSWFSDNLQAWEAAPANLASQVPIWARTSGTEEKLRDPFGGAQTSRVVTTFGYGSYGNVTSTSVDTFNSADTTAMSTVITSNNYAFDNPALWRLGRLGASTVTHRRPGMADVVRVSDFAYAMTGAATGFLIAERTQPSGSANQLLRREYNYDDYGNKTNVETCADPATGCAAAINFHPAMPTGIQRYSKTTYDTVGRYPVSTVEPFWSGTGAVEKTTSRVVSRNLFGDVTQAYDLNGVDTLAVAGTLGRPYYGWTETVAGSVPGAPAGGVESYTTYRFCGAGTNQVNCPSGAKFRQRVIAEGAPRTWTYFDVLGRPILKAAETFNIGVSGQDVSAVCTGYDAVGRAFKVSNPFFLAGTAGTDGPTGLDAVCTSASRLWTTTAFDVLGRPTEVQTPDPNGTAVVNTAYLARTTGVTDALGHVTNSVRNGKGELIQVVDANGLSMTYAYYADGTLKSVSRDAGRGAVVNSFVYDVLGRKIQQSDPDSGVTTFEYNALGELIAQIDANGSRVENEYDARGRIWHKTTKTAAGVVETQATITYDTEPNGIGQVANEAITGIYSGWSGLTGSWGLSYARSTSYDALGRASGTWTNVDSVVYTSVVQYDSLGRPWKGQDATGRWAKTEFNARGTLASVCDSSAADAVASCANDANNWLRTLKTDAWGHVLQERRGNSAALEVNRSYYAENGRLSEICGGSATCSLVKEQYVWDEAGNLSLHNKESRYTEQFTYDSLNRLIQSRMTVQNGVLADVMTQRYLYDRLGNICHRDTYGWASRDYAYLGRSGCGLGGTGGSTSGSGTTNAIGAHQAGDLNGLVHYYDAAGNVIRREGPTAGNDYTVKYNAANQAYDIATDTGGQSKFWYGPDGQRYKQQDQTGKVTLYVGGVEVVKQSGTTTYRRYLAGVLLQTVNGSSATNHYLFHDQLGSLVRIADTTGAVVSTMDYLAFGNRRNPANQQANGTPPSLTPRGFTGHEMLDGVNLIHMNARIFDPYLGRFLQPDPVVQSPGSAQSWNAYSYVLNNPLNATDPTGMFSLRSFLINPFYSLTRSVMRMLGPQASGIAVAVGCGAVPGWWSVACSAGGSYDMAKAFGASDGQAARAAVAGAITAAVGQIKGLSFGQRVFVTAVAGGIAEELTGGKFGHGFAAAGLTALIMPHLGGID
ncbi:MAG TPA: FG-GAP-like repeat-containing protein, partial [Pseudoxanthomonas sp.]|nr:FG-GAP-like repeat-containing protein [Pseudoxanthomonas sp.]